MLLSGTDRPLNVQAPPKAPITSPFDYEAWLVDLDGTLYRQDIVRAVMAIELMLSGWRDIRTLKAFRQEHERLRAEGNVESSDPYRQQIKNTATRLGRRDEQIAAIVERWMIGRPARWLWLFRRRKLLQAIAHYRAAGGKTALVSDYPTPKKLIALGAAGLFEVVVACGDSDAPCALKPHPAGFLRASKRLGVSPDACLVIGDRDDADGEAARRAGMAFLHVKMLTLP
jgi:FMN phosphatase YigB (HAD superfamily)